MAVDMTKVLASLEANVFYTNTASGTTVKSTEAAKTVYAVEIDNTGNTAASYVQIHNLAGSNVTTGTTVPAFVFRAPAASEYIQFLDPGIGFAFGTGVAVAVTIVGGAGSTAGPVTAVPVTLYTN